jgi:hypothetical protein
MRRACILVVAVLGWGCNGGGGSSCSQGSPARCGNNSLEICMKNWFDSSLYTYVPIQTCSAPQVCRTDTAGPSVNLTGENGCFDPNAYCPSAGWSECAATKTGTITDQIYECTLRPSDQTLRWSARDCSQLVPKSTCAAVGQTGTAACLEVVENCPAPPANPGKCDASDALNCSMTVIGDQAVYDWTRTPCSTGMVCQVLNTGFAYCVTP